MIITGHGYAIIVIIGTHHTQSACFLKDFPEGVFMDIIHFRRSNMRISTRIPLTGRLTVTVTDIVFRSGYNPLALYTFAHGYSDTCHQIGIFTDRPFPPPPALVSRYIQNRGIDVGVAHGTGFPAFNDTLHISQFLVPCTSQSVHRREAGGASGIQSSDTFIGEIGRNTQSGIFHKETLGFGQRRGQCIRISNFLVQVFVNVGYSVFQYICFPCGGRYAVFQSFFITVISGQLASFFIQVHL